MHRYFAERRECPRCHHRWSDDFSDTMINLKKVDFIWINRDQVKIKQTILMPPIRVSTNFQNLLVRYENNPEKFIF